MIHLSGVAVFRDGQRVPFTGGAREWVAWEQYALAHGLPTASDDPKRAAGITLIAFIAYRATTRDQATRPAFDAWLDTLDDVTDVDVRSADPTRAAPSLDSWSSSAPPAESTPNGSPNGHPASSPPLPTS